MTFPDESAVLATKPLPVNFAGGRVVGTRQWPQARPRPAPYLIGILTYPVLTSPVSAFKMTPLGMSYQLPTKSGQGSTGPAAYA